MSLSLKHVDACVPVTALKVLDWENGQFILQGQGSFVQLIDNCTGDVVSQVQAFRRNNVHGFIILSQRHLKDGLDHVQVMIWGGQSVRAIDVNLSTCHSVTLSTSSAEFLAPDWIMSGCAAVEDQPDTAYLITANNALLCSKLIQSKGHKYQSDIRLYQLATSVKSILYAADLIALSTSHVLIAAGTVFGEIIVWSCFLEDSQRIDGKALGSIHHFFTGHDGSIFGVQISSRISSLNGGKSGRLLASCSDDRTVRIWDISDCEHKTPQDPSAYTTDGFELRSTGFGVTADEPSISSEACVAKAFGHVARIWSVDFRPIRKCDPCMMGLVSRGEDSSCVLWDLSWEVTLSGSTQYYLRDMKSLHLHTGKHIWSHDLYSRGEETMVYTGGADGALKRFIINEADSLSRTKQGSADLQQPGPGELRVFTFVAPDYLIGCSVKGELQLGSVKSGGSAIITWESICTKDDLRSFVLVTGLPRQGLALIGNSQGLIRLYNHRTKSVSRLVDIGSRPLRLFALEISSQVSDAPADTLSLLVAYPTNDQATLMTITECTNSPRVETFTLDLPAATFAVSAASLVYNGEYLVLGSKKGGLAVYKVSSLDANSQPLVFKRNVHGRDGTTHIQVLPDTHGEGLEYVFTCGRDATYCIHELKVSGQGDELTLETVHQTQSALAGPIEGAFWDANSGDLVLYGWRSQNFILRNESRQTDIVSITSGGARRNWAFYPDTRKDASALFIWKEGSRMRTWQIQTDLQRCIRAGGHGREIRTMDASISTRCGRPLLATGAEDTAVRIFALSQDNGGPWGSFECVRTLPKHISGLQQIRWSNDGQYLFTSAAYEEFFVWRIGFVPTFGVTAVMVAAGPKDDPNSELRVTSFDIVDVEKDRVCGGFLLCLTLSNSTVKIMYFSPFNDNQITLLARGKYMTNCLTQARFCVKDSSINLITAATDGYCTIWNITTTLEKFYIISSSSLKLRAPITSFDISPETISCESRFQIHSNSIKGLELLHISNHSTAIFATGDDNSFTVSLLKTDASETDHRMTTVSVPDAHTASVTALHILRHQTTQLSGSGTANITVATSGNDHRIKIWSVTLDISQPGTDVIKIEFLLDRYSSVADISSLGLIKGPEKAHESTNSSHQTEAKLLVCGVGMELFELNLQ